MKAWLETSAVVSLYFRNRANREACLSVIPEGADAVISRYVMFELARGFLSRLRRFHNDSLSCTKWHELRALVKKGRNEYTYEGKCWRDALDDVEEALETGEDSKERGLPWMVPGKALAFFRARLRGMIAEGWDCCCEDYILENRAGCRSDLPAPYQDAARLLQHDLPVSECGKPGTCGLLSLIRKNREALERVRAETGKSKAKKKQGERERRLAGLEHLLSAKGEAFDGTQCHACGDAIIALESSLTAEDCVITKDKADFPPICRALRCKAPVIVPHV
ncbi:MAG TPA: hypothetical protein VG796_30815 [Verrucomicrobiales bacterium]|jgi:hypothetical protein|nr:hypothetical protein [Verrucomicrobiales bacterium]